MMDKSRNESRRRVPADVQARHRDQFVRELNAKNRDESAVKTAKLRALRLAKEEAERVAQQDRAAALGVAGANAEPKARKRLRRITAG